MLGTNKILNQILSQYVSMKYSQHRGIAHCYNFHFLSIKSLPLPVIFKFDLST